MSTTRGHGRTAATGRRAWRAGLVVALAALAIACSDRGVPASQGSVTDEAPPSPAIALPTRSFGGNGISLVTSYVFWSDDGAAMFALINPNELRRSLDGGSTWSVMGKLPSVELTLEFMDASNGWVCSINAVDSGQAIGGFRTTDGGKTWRQTVIATAPGSGRTFVLGNRFSDSRHGLLSAVAPDSGSSDGLLFGTDDGGATWSRVTTDALYSLVPAAGTAGGSGDRRTWLSGTRAADEVAVTEDGGQTWHVGRLPGVDSNASTKIDLFQALGSGHMRLAIVVSPAEYVFPPEPQPFHIFESVDGGRTWVQTYVSPASFDGTDVSAFAALSADHWLATRLSYTVDPASPPPVNPAAHFWPSAFVETRDAGRTWTPFEVRSVEWRGKTYVPAPPNTGLAAMLFYFRNDHEGLLLGSYTEQCGSNDPCPLATWFLTQDGGHTWREIGV